MLGVLAAQNALGNAYLEGAGVQQNTQLGIQWLIKASSNGDYFAQNSLGVMYLNGNGVPLDHKKAVEYFNLSIHNGNCARAMSNLSICYLQGYGIQQDPFKAKMWCQRAFENGYMPAEFKMPKIEEEISAWKAQFGDSKPSDLLDDPVERTIIEDLEKLKALSVGTNCLMHRDKYRFNPTVLLQLSKTSETAARILEAQFKFFKVFQLLQNRNTSVTDIAVDIQICEHLAYIMERGLEYIVVMPAELHIVLRQCVDRVLTANANMRAAAISLLYFEMGSSERRGWLINYLKKCQQSHPNDAFFHSFLASTYGFAQLWPEGLKEINLALAISPANVQYLYSQAVMLRNLESTEEAIAAYRLFLDKCEIDDRKRPEGITSDICSFCSFTNSRLFATQPYIVWPCYTS
jgi:TPR repeat protein